MDSFTLVYSICTDAYYIVVIGLQETKTALSYDVIMSSMCK